MSIAPIVVSIEVKAPPERAFELFVQHMARWWIRGKTVGKNPHERIVIEPRAGGRWYEEDSEGNQAQWGKVLAWDPPQRLLLAWQLNSRYAYDPSFETEVEMTFARAGSGTRVTLEHRHLERFGADVERISGQLRGGWPTLLSRLQRLADGLSIEEGQQS